MVYILYLKVVYKFGTRTTHTSKWTNKSMLVAGAYQMLALADRDENYAASKGLRKC